MFVVSIAEAFFILVIGFLTIVAAYFTWTVITPKLPIKIPPVLLCILIGCCMRLVAKPLLESPSADSAFEEWNTYDRHLHHEVISTPPPPSQPIITSPNNNNDTENITTTTTTTTTPAPSHRFRKLHVYGEGVVRTVSNPIVSFGLACVGILIGSHIDVRFLKQNTRPLLCLTGACALSAYLFTFLAGCMLWEVQLFLPLIHLVASTAMERSSSEALATISESKILSSSPPSSSAMKSAVYFVRSTIFAAASMDVIAVVVFVLSLGVIEKGGGAAHETILEIVLGTTFVAGLTLLFLKFHLTIEQKILQPVIVKWKLSDQPFSILRQPDRAAILVLCTLVASNYVIPGAELLLAAVAVGMKIAYDDQQQQQQNPSHHHDHSTSSSTPTSIISIIDHYSVVVYSILFSIIGLRLDAAQLAETLMQTPKISFTLFLGRLVGLCVGGVIGSILSGPPSSSKRKFMKFRGASLVTRIAVSIILLQKMEDAVTGSKPIVHASIGAVLIDMCVGPGLLQWSLKKVVEEAQHDATKKRIRRGEHNTNAMNISAVDSSDEYSSEGDV